MSGELVFYSPPKNPDIPVVCHMIRMKLDQNMNQYAIIRIQILDVGNPDAFWFLIRFSVVAHSKSHPVCYRIIC